MEEAGRRSFLKKSAIAVLGVVGLFALTPLREAEAGKAGKPPKLPKAPNAPKPPRANQGGGSNSPPSGSGAGVTNSGTINATSGCEAWGLRLD